LSATFESKPTVSRDYAIFAGIAAILILALCAWFTRSVYNSQISQRNHELEKAGNRIERTLTDSLDYITYLVEFMGKQIAEEGSGDPRYISPMLSNFWKDSRVQSILSWTGFDWVSPQGEIVITSTNGILTHPVDLHMRSYINELPKHPYKLLLEPDTTFGRTSAQWVISSAMGIKTRDGRYLGAVSFGFDAAALTDRIHQSISEETLRFAIINLDLNVVLQSPDAPIPMEDDVFRAYQQILSLPDGAGILPHPVDVGHISYAYYHKLPEYPYIIVMGYDKRAHAAIIWEKIFPLLLAFSGIGFVFLLMLHIFSKRIISPLKELSDIADKISKGKPHPHFPRNVPYEVFNLALQISKIKRYIARIQRIQQANVEAENARIRAQEADQAKSDFLAHVSHELRTPLNAIINFSDIQQTEIFGPMANLKYLEYSKDIHHSGLHLLQLINNLLDLSKAEANKVELVENIMDVSEVITDCVRTLRQLAVKNGLLLHSDVQPGLLPLYADSLRFKQIILNLLSNAIKFTQRGGKVTLWAGIEQGKLVIRVEDTGIGIAKEDIPRVMEKFGQASSPYYQRPDGTGLGLPLVKSLMELHNGTLQIESTLGVGTSVIVTFPESRICRTVPVEREMVFS
jgi:signal transduction histidine kinase